MALVTLVPGPGPGTLEGLEALLLLLLLSLAFAAFGWGLLCLCCFPEAWMPRYLDARIPGCLGAQMTTCQPRSLVAAAAALTALADLAAAAAVQVPIYLSDISITAGLTLHTNAMACNEQLFSLYTAGSAACAYACACADQW